MSPREHDVVPLHEPDDDETVRLLRRAMNREAEMVEPRDDRLEEIQRRTHEGGARRWAPWAAGVAAAAVVGLALGLSLGLGEDDEEPAPVAATDPTPSVSATGDATPTESSTDDGTDEPAGETIEGVPVYWLGDSETSVWLYREFLEVPDLGDPVTSAVAAMTRGEPLDPDYSTPWEPASSVSVTRDGDALTVDLSEDAFAEGVGSEVAELAIQQLVYTATAAAQTDGPVTITVDGEPYDAWGAIRVGEPMDRAPLVDVQAPTWVISPQHGETVPAGEVEVTGYGTAFEGTFVWEVRDAQTDEVVAEGFTMGGSMGTYDDFSFTVDLEPGEYVVEVYQEDMSGGESPEGPRMFPDTSRFTVQ